MGFIDLNKFKCSNGHGPGLLFRDPYSDGLQCYEPGCTFTVTYEAIRCHSNDISKAGLIAASEQEIADMDLRLRRIDVRLITAWRTVCDENDWKLMDGDGLIACRMRDGYELRANMGKRWCSSLIGVDAAEHATDLVTLLRRNVRERGNVPEGYWHKHRDGTYGEAT